MLVLLFLRLLCYFVMSLRLFIKFTCHTNIHVLIGFFLGKSLLLELELMDNITLVGTVCPKKRKIDGLCTGYTPAAPVMWYSPSRNWVPD